MYHENPFVASLIEMRPTAFESGAILCAGRILASLSINARTARSIFGRRTGQARWIAQRTPLDGHVFDSRREADEYAKLRLRELAGEISDLELQPRFDLVVNGVKVCFYKADFRYREGGAVRVIDVKSAWTKKDKVYRLKRKLMAACFPEIDVVEVF